MRSINSKLIKKYIKASAKRIKYQLNFNSLIKSWKINNSFDLKKVLIFFFLSADIIVELILYLTSTYYLKKKLKLNKKYITTCYFISKLLERGESASTGNWVNWPNINSTQKIGIIYILKFVTNLKF